MPKPLIIFEMANNHNAVVEHAKTILREFKKICRNDRFDYAFKLQYRNLDTFIHKPSRGSNHKQVKRFLSTELSWDQFLEIKNEIVAQGFISVCTPFDEISVDKVEEHGFDILKVASCSFTDWPLLERVAHTAKPLILSTAGATLEEMDQVVEFFLNREKDISLMHCVGEYPTPPEHGQLGQIDLFRQRYPGLRIGHSSHESPADQLGALIAAAKGAVIFEKHVGLPTERIALNPYSLTPEQAAGWIEAIDTALTMSGVQGRRRPITEKEAADLSNLKRGVFARRGIEAGELLGPENSYYAFPKADGQLAANDCSKYMNYRVRSPIGPDEAILRENLEASDIRPLVSLAHEKLLEILKTSGVAVAPNSECQLSHHYGLERFFEVGAGIVEVINRNYCKKLMILLPGQRHPKHMHRKKEESFQVLYGEFEITLGEESRICRPGDIVHVEPGVPHSFASAGGGIFEEVSSTHFADDSFYEDDSINRSPRRKTRLTFWNRHFKRSES